MALVDAGDNVTITGSSFLGFYSAMSASQHNVPDPPADWVTTHLPLYGNANLVVTNSIFSSFYTTLDLAVVEEGTVVNNQFYPNGYLDMLAIGLRGGRHLELGDNVLHGDLATLSTSAGTSFLGFRGGMFLPLSLPYENLLVTANFLACIGTRPGTSTDGEAFSVDANADSPGFVSGQVVTAAPAPVSCTVAGLATTCTQVTVTPAAGVDLRRRARPELRPVREPLPPGGLRPRPRADAKDHGGGGKLDPANSIQLLRLASARRDARRLPVEDPRR